MQALVAENARLVRAGSTPLLQLDAGNLDDAGRAVLSFSITNYGTAPARIAWMELLLDGRRIDNPSSMLRAVNAPEDQTVVSSSIAPSLIKAGEERRIFGWTRPEAPEAIAAWRKQDDLRLSGRLVTRACYCSLLGERWLSDVNGEIRPQTLQCEARGHTSNRG